MSRPERQRVGAYALVSRERGVGPEILLARMSHRTQIEGMWTLPGGGIDHGEAPRLGVVREVYEETGLVVHPSTVVDVYSHHIERTRSDGAQEDYHGLYIVYDAELDEGSRNVEPHVTESHSSTELSTWVPLAAARELPLLKAAAAAIEKRFPD